MQPAPRAPSPILAPLFPYLLLIPPMFPLLVKGSRLSEGETSELSPTLSFSPCAHFSSIVRLVNASRSSLHCRPHHFHLTLTPAP